MAGARNRSDTSVSLPQIACYNHYSNAGATNSTVKDNICQGSQGNGFILPFVPCGALNTTSGYIDNTVGSAKIGYLMTNIAANSNGCKAAGHLKAYGCDIGITSNPIAYRVQWTNLMLADNKRALGLRFGGPSSVRNNSVTLTNSWISALSRTTCEECYGDQKTSCSGLSALRLLTVTNNGDDTNFDNSIQNIGSVEELDSNAWIINVTFENFKNNYSTLTSALSNKCSNNNLFQVHPSTDSSVANHHFYNTTCTGCEADAMGYFSAPIQANLGSAGGCGTILCTGRQNYLMLDHDGSLLGFAGAIVPSNAAVGALPNCTLNVKSNGYVCNRTDLGRLLYYSIAKDYNSRVMWPVNLTNEATQLSTEINAWRETNRLGTEPANTRLARFLSIIQYGASYNMSFAAQPPSDMIFSLSLPQPAGDISKWVVIKIYYPVPNSISVSNINGIQVLSLLASGTDEVASYPSMCGVNKYLYKESIVHFLVNADPSCQIRVTLTSSVQVTAKLNVEVSKFFENDGAAKFLDMISAFLNIPANRLKIVGVYSGSTIVDFTINPPLSTVSDSTNVNPGSTEIIAELKTLAAKLSTAGPADIGSLLSMTTTVTAMDESGKPVPVDPVDPTDPTEEEKKQNDNTKYIIIGCVVGAVVLALIGVAIWLIVVKVRGRDGVEPTLDESPEKPRKEAESELQIRDDSSIDNQLSNNVSLRPMVSHK